MTAAFHARILVVDDEPSAAREIAEQLRAFGCEVLGIATTSEQALELAARAAPDLVLLEQRRSPGSAASSAMLRERLGVPVVQVSGQAPELRSAIESALERAQLERHLCSLQRKADAAERSAALGALAAGLTRELDSPLDFVIGNQQYAQRELGALRELIDGLTPKRRALALELVSEIEATLRDSIFGVEKLRAMLVRLKRLGQPLASEPRLLDVRDSLDASLTITRAELAARARAPQVLMTTPALPRPADAQARLLFVDDEPILLDALMRALEGHYAVARASGGPAALELLGAGHEYDLLVCDLMMPGMTGMDLFNALEARFPHSASRMAFMTGGAFTLPAQEFISVAGRRVLEKPFTNDELFAFIAGCLQCDGACASS